MSIIIMITIIVLCHEMFSPITGFPCAKGVAYCYYYYPEPCFLFRGRGGDRGSFLITSCLSLPYQSNTVWGFTYIFFCNSLFIFLFVFMQSEVNITAFSSKIAFYVQIIVLICSWRLKLVWCYMELSSNMLYPRRDDRVSSYYLPVCSQGL